MGKTPKIQAQQRRETLQNWNRLHKETLRNIDDFARSLRRSIQASRIDYLQNLNSIMGIDRQSLTAMASLTLDAYQHSTAADTIQGWLHRRQNEISNLSLIGGFDLIRGVAIRSLRPDENPADGEPENFALEYVERLESFDSAETEAEQQESIAEFFLFLSRILQKLTPSRSTVEYLFPIMLSILLWAEAKWDAKVSQKADREHVAQIISQSEERLSKEIQALRPARPRPQFLTSRSLHLRVGPSKGSESILVLHPGKLVEGLQEENGWVQILYFDLLAGEQRTGWVYGRFLLALPHEET